jgi:sRNA-binding carbon storage regulator CsrA
MLILTRRQGQSLTINPEPSIDPDTPVARLFANGPIRVQVLGLQGPPVRLGVEANPGFCILRDELLPPDGPLAESVRRVLARKLKVLMFCHRHSTQSLAAASGLDPARVWAAESGAGRLQLDDLERLAVALGVKVVELFKPAGRTAAERLVLAILEGDGKSE